MVKMPNALKENVDYEMIPGDDDHWWIRIKTGDYIESVLSFGTIKMNDQTGMVNFDFYLHSSPDPDLTVEDLDLQKYMAKLLESVLVDNINAIENHGQKT